MESAASYQFVAQAKNGEWVRSTVYTDLSLLPCGGGGAPPPHITVSPSGTPDYPPATNTPIWIR